MFVGLFSHTVVSVRWEETNYEFVEGHMEPTNVCVASSGEKEIPFIVTFSTTSGTAQGKHKPCFSIKHHIYNQSVIFAPFILEELDYQGFVEDLTFDVSESRKCFDIGLVDDSILENDEFFTILLASTNERILILTNSCTVTIIDDDSKSY